MLDDLVKNIQSKLSPRDWKIHGFSMGDNFDSIINDSSLYNGSKMIKSKSGALFYKSKDSNLIAGVFLAISFFDNRQEEILNEIQGAFGDPYFDHIQLNNRILYYPSHDLYVEIIQDDISKGMCLGIGESGRRLRKFTAIDIIDSYFGIMNLQTFLFELEDRSSLPKLTRLHLEMLESLLLAFLGNPSIKRFMTGKFVLECDDRHLRACSGIKN